VFFVWLVQMPERLTMYTVFHMMLFLAGGGLLGHAMDRDGNLIANLEARLSRELSQPATGELALHAPEFWLPLMVLAGGFLLLWGAIGLLPMAVQAIGVIGTGLGAVLAGILRSTAFQIAVCCMVFYVGQVAFTGFMVQHIYEDHIQQAARQLDLRFDERPDLNDQVRRVRDLMKGVENF
jgi:hypothetical protein